MPPRGTAYPIISVATRPFLLAKAEETDLGLRLLELLSGRRGHPVPVPSAQERELIVKQLADLKKRSFCVK